MSGGKHGGQVRTPFIRRPLVVIQVNGIRIQPMENPEMGKNGCMGQRAYPRWILTGTLIMVQGSRMAITGRMAEGVQPSPYHLGQGDVVPTLARLNDYGKC